MTTFEHFFEQTDSAPGDTVAGKLARSVRAPAGVFESGLLSVLDENVGKTVLKDWQWFLGGDAIGLASTWQGNLFFWSPRHGACFYLDTQRGKTTFVDRSVESLFNSFLPQEAVKENVLFKALFDATMQRLGGLTYCKCYYAKPWPMLGGSGDLNTYEKGDLEVYASLTGQTMQKFTPNGW